MEAKFKVVYSEDAYDFLNRLPKKIKDKIIYNIAKAKFVIDPELWDKENGKSTLVIATHGFIKKTLKTPPKEIAKAEEIRKAYFNQKK